ncbi:MAG: hypothetical protein KC656_35325, partial [Myxococcales bacterium]|nr:hypothetical protein [Myxococcales bacterium]
DAPVAEVPVVLWLWASLASAQCEEVLLPEPMEIAADPSDTRAPKRPEFVTADYEIVPSLGCDDCPDLLFFDLTVVPPEEDPDQDVQTLGYRVRVIDGALPPSILLPDHPFPGTAASFRWLLDRADLVAGLDVTLEIRTVDGAGNESTGSIEIEIAQDGLPPVLAGCATAPVSLPWALLLGAGAIRRRRTRG